MAGFTLQTAQQLSGITFFLYYSTKIFNSIGVDGQTANLVFAFGMLFGGVLCMFTLNKLGRKVNIVGGCFCQALSFYALYAMKVTNCFTMLYPVCIFYIVAYSIGLGGTSYAFGAEILPPTGVGLTITVQWLWSAVIGEFTPFFADVWPGVQSLMLVFAVICTIGVFA